MLQQNLDYFLEIAECRSLTRAAEKLYVSQPSLSQYLKRLENNLGVELFDRNSQPLRLTEIGERYLAYAREARQMEENIRREIQDMKSELRGTIRLGVTLWRGSTLLPDIFPGFRRAFPGIKIELSEGSFDFLKGEILNDSLELAISPIMRGSDFRDLSVETLKEERILLAIPAEGGAVGDPAEAGPEGAPADGDRGPGGESVEELILRYPLILTKPGQNLTYEVEHYLAKRRLEPEILLRTANLTTAIHMVAEGTAATFVPEEGAAIYARDRRIRFVALEGQDLVWDLAAICKKDAYLNRITRVFIDYVREHMV